jgi:hypothetical protein
MPIRRLLLLALSISLLAPLFSAGAATANEVANLDPAATSNGNVVIDPSGNAYIAWTHEEAEFINTPIFCRIPAGAATCNPRLTLPVPGAVSSIDSVTAAFPVLGAGSTVYVVAPRYVSNDVVVYTSVNGGASFAAGVVVPGGYSNQTDPTNVLSYESEFLIGAFNSQLGVSTSPAAGTGLSLALPPGDLVGGSSIGLDAASDPVLAYWTLTDPYKALFFRYDGSGPVTSGTNWIGPTQVTNGYETKLSGGPGGLFLVSADQVGGEPPTAVNVRKYAGSSFGPPVTLTNDGAPSLFTGGAIAQSPSGGRLAVAWPGTRAADRRFVLRLHTSTDGGASFTSTDIADLSNGFFFGDKFQLGLADGGGGWLTYLDAAGLHLVDFSAIAGVPQKDPPKGGTKPADYKGPTKVADTKKAGDFDLTLRLPKSCVQSQQSFFAGVGKRKRKGLSKQLGGKIKFKSVVFVYDGKKLKVKKKKPFRLLIDPGAMAPGSTHVVKTKVTAILTKGGKEKKIKRTLQGSIKAC